MASDHYEFGPFCFDTAGRLLLRGGKMISLTPKAAQTLLLLVENAGNVVAKEELLKKIWQDTFIEEGSLTRTISILRKTLSVGQDDQQYISTISKRGYCFTGEVQRNYRRNSSSLVKGKVMLAVLPFMNFSAEKDQEYFSDGLT